jgi:hypothetical protein
MKTTNIYTLTDPITNEIRYVGKANRIDERYKAHLNRARKHQIHKKNWIESLRKKGLKPIISIVDIVLINDWQFWETYWISQMKTWGFNLINYTNGGDGATFGNQTSFKKGHKCKRVIGYDKEYNLVHDFECADDATKFFKLHRSTIPNCALGKRKTSFGFAWFYYDDISKLDKIEINNKISERFKITYKPNSGSFTKNCVGIRSKQVLMYDDNWNFITEFKSAKEAANYIGVTGGAIQYACTKSINNKCRNNKFKYK